MGKQYINAVVELLLQGKSADVVIAQLKKVLSKKGHLSIFPKILSGVVFELERKLASNGSTIIVATKSDADKLQKVISAALEKLNGNLASARVEIDKTLIGGFIAIHNGKAIDTTYKQKLIALYRSITK